MFDYGWECKDVALSIAKRALENDAELIKVFDKSEYDAHSVHYEYLIGFRDARTRCDEWQKRVTDRAFGYVLYETNPRDLEHSAWLFNHLLCICPYAHDARTILVQRILTAPAGRDPCEWSTDRTKIFTLGSDSASEIAEGVFRVYSDWACEIKSGSNLRGGSAIFSLLGSFKYRMPFLEPSYQWTWDYFVALLNRRNEMYIGENRRIGVAVNGELVLLFHKYVFRGPLQLCAQLLLHVLDKPLDIPLVAPAMHASIGTAALQRVIAECTQNNCRLPPLYAEQRAVHDADAQLQDRFVVHVDDGSEQALVDWAKRRVDFRHERDRLRQRLVELEYAIGHATRSHVIKHTVTETQMNNLRAILVYPRYTVFRLFFELAHLALPKEVALRIAYYVLPLETDCFPSRYALLQVHDRAVQRLHDIMSRRERE